MRAGYKWKYLLIFFVIPMWNFCWQSTRYCNTSTTILKFPHPVWLWLNFKFWVWKPLISYHTPLPIKCMLCQGVFFVCLFFTFASCSFLTVQTNSGLYYVYFLCHVNLDGRWSVNKDILQFFIIWWLFEFPQILEYFISVGLEVLNLLIE
jgi:hypothetical protein